jgi:sporulation protein YunB
VCILRGYRKKKYGFAIIIAILLVLALLIFIFIDLSIKPTVIAMSDAQVRYIAIKAMNNAVKSVLNTNVKYTDLINVMTDRNGKIALIQANTIRMNALASETSSIAQDEIRSIGQEGIYIPVGSIFGSEILAGLGPKIKVTIIPIGSISTDFTTEFENAGINQTRHKIYMVMQAQVRIVIPLGSETARIDTRVPITETIIVGDVPDYYVNVDETDRMLNLVPKPK